MALISKLTQIFKVNKKAKQQKTVCNCKRCQQTAENTKPIGKYSGLFVEDKEDDVELALLPIVLQDDEKAREESKKRFKQARRELYEILQDDAYKD